jgi:hypothetical protein
MFKKRLRLVFLKNYVMLYVRLMCVALPPGGLLSSQTAGRYSSTLMPSTFTQMHGRTPSVSYLPKFDMRKLSTDSERFVNASNTGTAAIILITFYEQCWWFLQAIMCGFLITGFTWFIIYKDSRIPGINPPTPFSPFRQR